MNPNATGKKQRVTFDPASVLNTVDAKRQQNYDYDGGLDFEEYDQFNTQKFVNKRDIKIQQKAQNKISKFLTPSQMYEEYKCNKDSSSGRSRKGKKYKEFSNYLDGLVAYTN